MCFSLPLRESPRRSTLRGLPDLRASEVTSSRVRLDYLRGGRRPYNDPPMTLDFRNEPILDFSRNTEAQAALQKAIDTSCRSTARWSSAAPASRQRPRSCRTIPASRTASSGAPPRPRRPRRRRRSAAPTTYSPPGRAPPPGTGPTCFSAPADLMRRRRHELNATLVLEVGKTWTEADADTAEAIDFCEYYAREMLRYAQEQPLTPAKANATADLPVPGRRRRDLRPGTSPARS